jgi:cytochrome c
MVLSGQLALAATLLTAPLVAASAQAPAKPMAGNAAAGARQYLQCRACHTATKGGAHGVGPNLWGIMGSKSATRPGYAYSPAMQAAALSWTPDRMDSFLAKPNARVPGNKMAFAGMANTAARRDLIAYLTTLQGK